MENCSSTPWSQLSCHPLRPWPRSHPLPLPSTSCLFLRSNRICHPFACLLCFSGPFLLSSLPVVLRHQLQEDRDTVLFISPNQGFSAPGSRTVWARASLVWGSVNCRRWGSTPGLHLQLKHTLSPSSDNPSTFFRHCQRSLGGGKSQNEHHW